MNLIHTGGKATEYNILFRHTGWSVNYRPISPIGILVILVMPGNYKNQLYIMVVVWCMAQQPRIGP